VVINGEVVLAAAPAYKYFEYPHNLLFVFAIVVICVYCIPVPIACILKARSLFVRGAQYLATINKTVASLPPETTPFGQPSWMRNSDSMHKALTDEYTEFLYNTSSTAYQRYGVLFFAYKPEFYWWKGLLSVTFCRSNMFLISC
jgi:hypothetical protein